MTTILIADDIAENRYLLSSLLEGSGYRVLVATNGAEALEQARRSAPDLIISDVLMPTMDGFELCRQWKRDERLKTIPFVVYTATYTDPQDERLVRSLGADRFVVKPQKVEVLLQLVREVLDAGGRPRAPEGDDRALVQAHNEALVRKLEDKVRQLEAEICARDAAQAQAKTAGELLEVVIESLPAAVLLKNARDFRYLHLNRAAEAAVGKPRAEVLGKSDYDLVPRERADALTRYDRQALETRATVTVPEEATPLLDGAVRVLQTKKVPIFGASGAPLCILSVSEDVTELRQAELERLRTREALESSQRLESIGRLAGGVAHDFNNLLTVILSYSGFAIDSVRAGDPLREDLGEIRKAAERAAVLTRQLLAFSRKQVLAPKVLDLNKVVSGLEDMLRRLLGERIEIHLRCAQGLGHVRADPGQLEQVLMNLAVNARDAMPQGGKLLIDTANVDLDGSAGGPTEEVQPGPHVLLSVTDTGVGMPAGVREHIFEPFFTTKDSGQGTGLGLSIVHGVVKQSGGTIFVYSEPGRGTTFKIYLPRVDGAAEDPSRPSEPALARGTERVLVVEDEQGVRGVAERVLRAAGYRVFTAANGGEALLLCEQTGGAFDLLLTDVIMPHMTGPALAARLARLCPKLAVLYMSGYPAGALAGDEAPEPNALLISKPFTGGELTRRVRQALDAAPR